MKDGSYFEEHNFKKTRLQAAKHNAWANGFSYQSLLNKNDSLKRHCYLTSCQVLGKAGAIVELARWRLPKDKG